MGKRGQVWVETMLYTLIAFVMIGIVLYFATPKISEAQDSAILEQSVKMMEEINLLMENLGDTGNKRLVETTIKKGELKIDSAADQIIFEMESKYLYSEADETIYIGNMQAFTEDKGEFNLITLTLDYSELYDITYNGGQNSKTLTASSSAYDLFISKVSNDPTVIIDFNLL